MKFRPQRKKQEVEYSLYMSFMAPIRERDYIHVYIHIPLAPCCSFRQSLRPRYRIFGLTDCPTWSRGDSPF